MATPSCQVSQVSARCQVPTTRGDRRAPTDEHPRAKKYPLWRTQTQYSHPLSASPTNSLESGSLRRRRRWMRPIRLSVRLTVSRQSDRVMWIQYSSIAARFRGVHPSKSGTHTHTVHVWWRCLTSSIGNHDTGFGSRYACRFVPARAARCPEKETSLAWWSSPNKVRAATVPRRQ